MIRIPVGTKTRLRHAPQDQQIALFINLALNVRLAGACTLNTIDDYMKYEKIFYTCRAVRRLLLGIVKIPVIFGDESRPENPVKLEDHIGQCLVLTGDGFHFAYGLQAKSYLHCIMSREHTDPVPWAGPRAIYFSWLRDESIDYTFMFRLISRYISFVQFEECYVSFIKTVEPDLRVVCENNYFLLLDHLRCISRGSALPRESAVERLAFIRFNVCSFITSWGGHSALNGLKEKVLNSLGDVELIRRLSKVPYTAVISISDPAALTYQATLNQILPYPPIVKHKKDPGPTSHLVQVLLGSGSQWLAFPGTLPIYRIAFSLLFADSGSVRFDATRPECRDVGVSRLLVSMFNRMDTAPKDTVPPFHEDYSHVMDSQTVAKTDPLNFMPMNSIGINGYKITVFNTNMVINTKIRTLNGRGMGYRSVLDVPRLTNNFVNRKFSVKEPAFTTSVFYSENMCEGAAININISGDQLQFMFAMGIFKCIVPILSIYPVSVANWNSTMDLHGLENQALVRSGRKDVFWTTNFPSVISTKSGFNVSWFKAATANISRIHGSELYTQVVSEVKPIIETKDAKIDKVKNRLFTRLENRNRGQINVLHKMFLESLYEVVSFKRLNCVPLNVLVEKGVFDYSKKIICHSKSKHECCIVGYRKSEMIPKILIRNRKVRLDRLGRNANFLSFVKHLGRCDTEVKQAIVRHIGRRFGLWWRRKLGSL